MDDTKVGQGSKDDPAEVARQGFAALMDGEQTVVAGSLKTKSMAAADKLLPTPSRPSSIARWQNRQRVLAHIGAEIGEARRPGCLPRQPMHSRMGGGPNRRRRSSSRSPYPVSAFDRPPVGHSGPPSLPPLREGERLREWISPISAGPAFKSPDFVLAR
jgi:hypothetical protein